MDGTRLDKWLWAARFFKTRALAAGACEIGRVECRGQRAKPAREVHLGDRLRITNASGIFDVEVLGLSEVRGPAARPRAVLNGCAMIGCRVSSCPARPPVACDLREMHDGYV